MADRIREHIRSNVVGYVAVFLALTGGAYAIDGPLPGQNQVGSEDIINNEVQSPDIGDGGVRTADIRGNAVTSGRIADGEVLSADVRNDGLTGADIDELSLGQVPSAGNAIDAQFAGHADDATRANEADFAFTAGELRGVEVVTNANNSNTVRRSADVFANCPVGKSVIGGGGDVWGGFQFEDAIALISSKPVGSSWYVKGRTTVTASEPWNAGVNVTAYAICARTSP